MTAPRSVASRAGRGPAAAQVAGHSAMKIAPVITA